MFNLRIINPAFLSGLIFSKFTYRIKNSDKDVYLTFDDGPDPHVTPFVLDLLAEYGAKATFFMRGINVVKHPELVARVLQEGHAIGNHSFSHPDGWRTDSSTYCEDVFKASKFIDSEMFRPPYGRIKPSQSKQITKHHKIVMWDVMSHDYADTVSPEKCAANVLKHYKGGSIIVFHDSHFAFRNLQYALPRVMRDMCEKGFNSKALSPALLRG